MVLRYRLPGVNTDATSTTCACGPEACTAARMASLIFGNSWRRRPGLGRRQGQPVHITAALAQEDADDGAQAVTTYLSTHALPQQEAPAMS